VVREPFPLPSKSTRHAVDHLVQGCAKVRRLCAGHQVLGAVDVYDQLDDATRTLLREYDFGESGPGGILRERRDRLFGPRPGVRLDLAVSFGDLYAHVDSRFEWKYG